MYKRQPIENGYIRGVEFIKDNIQKIKDKQIIIFYVGLGLYTLDEIMLFNFLPTYKYKNIKFFELMGDFNYKRLNFMDKIRVKYGSGKMCIRDRIVCTARYYTV